MSAKSRPLAALLAAFLLFGAVPAAFVRFGAHLYLDDEERGLVEERLREMRRTVESLAEEIRGDAPKFELVQEAVRALSALPELTGEAVNRTVAEFARLYPGLLTVSVHDYPDRDDPVARGERYRFRAVGGEGLTFRALHTELASFLYHFWRGGERFGKEIPPPKGALVTQHLIGTRTRPLAMALARSEPHPADHRGREAWLAWDLVGRTKGGVVDNEKGFRGLVILIADEEAYRAQFSAERLVERRNATLGGRFRAGILPAQGAPLPPELAGLPAEALRDAARSSASIERGETLVAFAPVSKEEGRYLYAAVPRARIDPGRPRAQRRIDLLLLLALALLLALLLLDHAGIIRPAVPIRAQLFAFLLLAALPPLGALFHFGLEHLRALREIETRAAAERILARISELDGALVGQLADFRRIGLSFRDRLNAGESSDSVRADLERMLRRDDRELIDEYFLFNGSGEVLLAKDSRKRDELLMGGLASVAISTLHYANRNARGARGRKKPASGGGGMLGAVAGFLTGEGGMTDAIIKTRERIHRLNMLGTDACVMLEPILSADGISYDRAFALTFDLKVLQKDRIFSFVNETHRTEAQVRLYAGHAALRYRKFPNASHFDEPRARFLDRLIGERSAAQELFASSGETLLAAGRMLREAPDYAVFGIVPQSVVTEKVEARLALFRWAFLLTLLAALATAVAIARRVVTPLARIGSGVGAVAAGDYGCRVAHESRDEFGALASAFNAMVEGLEEKERMSRYVSDFVRDGVKGGAATAAGETRATILFSDIRDFTTLAEAHGAAAIVEMLNGYFDRMSSVVRRNGGVVDKYIGDALMAVFRDRPDSDARDAVCCALEMRRELARFNLERARAGSFEIETGIGLSTGRVILGDIGSADRLDRTVIGDQVNLAARLETLSKEGRHTKIILDGETLRAAEDLVVVEPLGERTVKGKTRSVEVVEVRAPRAAEAYAPLLSSADPRARVLGARLVRLATDGDRAGLFAPLLDDPDPSVRAEAARGL